MKLNRNKGIKICLYHYTFVIFPLGGGKVTAQFSAVPRTNFNGVFDGGSQSHRQPAEFETEAELSANKNTLNK